MKYATTACQVALTATVLFTSAAACRALAEEASPPDAAMPARDNDREPSAGASSAGSDLDDACDSRWLAQCRAGIETASPEQAPCWAWCVLGVMSLVILGLFSFGWREMHLAAEPEGAFGGVAGREQRGRTPVGRAEAPVAKASAIPCPKGDATELADDHRTPLHEVLRPYSSVCVGLCGGGDVWIVACGA